MKRLEFVQFPLGADPEFFLKKGSAIVGAEEVMPKAGVKTYAGKSVIDGVQAEFNPNSSTCRVSLASHIQSCFNSLNKHLKETGGAKIQVSIGVKIKQVALDKLSKKSKEFGCAPSKNSYTPSKKISPSLTIKNPDTFKFRMAGGHLHFGRPGVNPNSPNDRYGRVAQAIDNPELTVPVLDYVLGNTSVLIDRDKHSAERRKYYGMAGEYRTPKHGLEYRVLGNWWLRAYPLMSMVTGFGRLAVIIAAQGAAKEITSLVPRKDIIKAINENDMDLAYTNWKKIKKVLVEMTSHNSNFPITRASMPNFEFFITKPLKTWFPKDPLYNWTQGEGMSRGWERFLSEKVSAVRLKEKEDK